MLLNSSFSFCQRLQSKSTLECFYSSFRHPRGTFHSQILSGRPQNQTKTFDVCLAFFWKIKSFLKEKNDNLWTVFNTTTCFVSWKVSKYKVNVKKKNSLDVELYLSTVPYSKWRLKPSQLWCFHHRGAASCFWIKVLSHWSNTPLDLRETGLNSL